MVNHLKSLSVCLGLIIFTLILPYVIYSFSALLLPQGGWSLLFQIPLILTLFFVFKPKLNWGAIKIDLLLYCIIACVLTFIITFLSSNLLYGLNITYKFDVFRPLTDSSLIGLYISALIFAPILEELLYRGLLQPTLSSWSGAKAGVILSAALFSLLHFNTYSLIPLFVLGVYQGFVYNVTKNLFYPILIHVAYNAFVLTLNQI